MYAEHVLRVPVDWSTLPSTGFGRLSEMYLTRKPTQIPYVAVPVWFRSDPALLDDPESPIPANCEPWSWSRPRKRRRVSADNELDRDLGAAFAQMEMIGAGEAMTRADGADGAFTRADGVSTEPDGVLTGADRVFTRPDGVLIKADGMFTGPDRVFTGPEGVMARPDGVEIRGVHNISTEEQNKLLADVAAYKARISFLESKLAELGFTEDASNDDSVVWAEELFKDRVVEQPENQAEDQAPMPIAPVFPPNEADRKDKRQMTDLELWRFEERLDPQTTLQEQLDSALDWMNLADHFATALAFENQALANKMDELRQRLRHVEGISVNAIKMEEELLEARAFITTYEVMEDNTQELERQNRNHKRCLTELAGEFDTYRDCTIFAVARARQYEAEFKAIQEEWVVIHRLRALLLTSWPLIDTMYDDKWPTDPSGGVAWKEIEDESNRWDVSKFNNVSLYGKNVAKSK
jgi:hypothetical protein